MNRVLALAGNPNVGKSTLFNALTGLHQHTGNWPGKTVERCEGVWHGGEEDCRLIDLPGAYSLHARSAEEAVTRDYLLSGEAQAVIVVCDAACLKRNLFLALQVAEAVPRAVVCVNLLDEARRRHVSVDLERLSREMGLPVAGTSARSRTGIGELMETALQANHPRLRIAYDEAIERALGGLIPTLSGLLPDGVDARWAGLRLLSDDRETLAALNLDALLGLEQVRAAQEIAGQAESVRSRVTQTLHERARRLADSCTRRAAREPAAYRADRLLTGRGLGIPAMLALLGLVLLTTIVLANAPSQWLSALFARLGRQIDRALAPAPGWLHAMLYQGVYRVLSWVVSVMLPPMALFFPLFTLLEDVGYLPRAAFNMDRCFQGCRACGKQCLTMMMGLGCNAVGVCGCRIIDSPRERLIALLTNSLTPCNGRFPMLIALSGAFLAGGGPLASLKTALCLTGLIVLSVALTLGLSRLLSATLLRGMPSSFALELPPYRRPQVGKVIVRSLLDRTIKVLGRALVTAAPAGALIWLLGHVQMGGMSLLARLFALLDPLGRLLGMDGVMLSAFVLGTPANEIVLPIALMGYLGEGTLVEADSLASLPALLAANGWNARFALCAMLFSLCHWPCATTLVTIARETRSAKWTLLSALLPTLCGMGLCMLTRLILA
ncbi:MAG: ferrous iron transport protein B [Eubacteriales bacterium]|nr:ferrous iron transport protein B [Eubacteriales bacterium]